MFALTPIEYEMLPILAVNAGSMVTVGLPAASALGRPRRGRPSAKKLRDSPAEPASNRNVRGLGYLMPAPPQG